MEVSRRSCGARALGKSVKQYPARISYRLSASGGGGGEPRTARTYTEEGGRRSAGENWVSHLLPDMIDKSPPSVISAKLLLSPACRHRRFSYINAGGGVGSSGFLPFRTSAPPSEKRRFVLLPLSRVITGCSLIVALDFTLYPLRDKERKGEMITSD